MTDEELDALVARLKEPWNQRQSRRVAEEFDAADAITTLRAQLAAANARAAQADYDARIRSALTAQPSPDVAALVEALRDALLWTADCEDRAGWRGKARAALARVKGGA